MKKRLLHILLLLGVFCTTQLYSQAPAWMWARSNESAGIELARDVTVLKSTGDVWITGSYATNNLSAKWGGNFNTNYGGTDAFLVKYSTNGVVTAAIRIGGAGNDVGYSTCVDAAGNVYVAGSFAGTANFWHTPALAAPNTYDLTSNAGTADIFLAKYNSAGVFQWATKAGGASTDAALGVYVDANGVYLTGTYLFSASMTFSSYASVTTTAITTAGGNTDVFIAKYTTGGLVQWVAKAGSTGADAGYDIVADEATGNIYTIGDYAGANNFNIFPSLTPPVSATTHVNQVSDIFISAHDQNGGFLWSTNISSAGTDLGRSIAFGDNDLYVTGGIANNANFKNPLPAFTRTATSTQDLFLAKLNKSTGVFQYAITENGSGVEYGNSISYLSPGKVFIGGQYSANLTFTNNGGLATNSLSSQGGYDAFLASYNSTNGSFIYSKKAGGINTDRANGVGVNNSGDAYLGGEQGGALTFTAGTNTVTPASAGSNIFIAKCGCGFNLIPAAGPVSTTTCSTTYNMVAATLTNVTTGLWTLISPPGALITNNTLETTGITNLSPGANVFRWTVSKAGCASVSETITVVRDVLPTTSVAGASIALCGTTTVLAGNVPAVGQGTWTTFAGTSTITNANLATSAVSVAPGSPFSTTNFSWTIGNGICPVSTSTVSIVSYTTTSPSNAGSTMSLCGTSTLLAGNVPAAGTGTWSTFAGTSTITNVNLATSAVTVAAGSPFSTTNFSWTIQNGVCPATTSTVSIISYTNTPASVPGPSMNICGTTTVMAANVPAAGTGTWSTFAGTSTLTNVNLATTAVTVAAGSPFSTTNFSWTIQNGVCPATTNTVSILSHTLPTVSNAGANQTVCATTATMNGNTPSVGTGTWSLVSGAGVPTSPNSPNTAITGLGIGVNVFQWVIGNGICPNSTSTMSIQQDQVPTTSNAGPNQTVCATTATLAGNTPAIGTGAWNVFFGPGFVSAPSLPNSGVISLGLGSNVFEWVITNGVCPASSSTVEVFQDTNPTTSNAGPSQSICAITVATMAGNVPAVGSGTWSLVSGSGLITSPNSPVSGITSIGIGTNVFQWAIGNGVCPVSTSTMAITRFIPPTTSIAGANQTVCATVATMNGNTPAIGTGSWTLISGAGTITTPTLETTGITALGVGINVFQWTISNGNCTPSTSTVSIQRDDNPTTSVAGSNQTVCANFATLNGNNPAVGTGTWSLVSGAATITSPNLFNTGLTALGIGVNVLQWTIGNGVCPSSSSTVSVQQDANPTTALAGPNQTVCTGAATLAGNTPAIGTGIWLLQFGSGVPTTPTAPNSALTGLSLGSNIFSWNITNGVCPVSTATVEIYRDNSPSLSNAGPNQTVCATFATLAGNTPAVGTGSWTLVFGSGNITTPTSPSSGLTALGAGINVFAWTVTNGSCPPSTSTVSIQQDLNPTVANAGPSQTICALTTANMAGNTAAIGTGTWSLISGAGTITSPNLETTGITALGVGVNVFQWTIGNGVCPSSSSTMSITRDLNPSTSVAGVNQTVCATFATLNGNNPAVGTGTWSLVSGIATITSPNLFNTGLTALGAGINVLQWTIGNGSCPNSSSTVSVQRDLNPSTSVAGANQTVCATTATLNGNNPAVGTGTWSLVSGVGTITSPNLFNTGLTALGGGVNVFQWTIGNGVCANSSSTVIVQRDLNPSTSVAGPSQTICANTATFAANTPVVGVGVWNVITGPGIIMVPTSPNSQVITLGFGSNIFEWQITNGVCPASTSTVEIYQDQNPTVSNAGTSQSICLVSSATLNGNVPAIGTGTWTLVSGSGFITSPNSPNSGLTALGIGTNIFQWTIGSGVCPSSSSTVSVTRYLSPSASAAGANQTVCATVATMAGNTPGIGTGLWTLVSGAGTITSPTLPNTGLTALGVGVNVFQWTISNGNCPPSSSTVSIQRDDNPTPSVAGANQTVCATVATLNGNNPAVGTGTWSLVSGAATITSPNLFNTGLTALGAGINVLQWTIGNGVCPSSSSTVSIQRDLNPSTSVAGANQTVCATVATLNGNNPAVGTGTWSLVSGAATITSPNLFNTGLTALGAGVNVLQWTIGNGVCASSSSTVSVQRDLNPSTSVAGANQTVCATVATLNGNNPAVGTGTWSLVSGAATITSPNLFNTGLTALGVGVNVLQWTIGNGVCANSSSTVSVQQDLNPTVANAGPNQTICALTTANMAGNTAAIGTGTWSLISGAGTITSPNLETTGITALGVGVNVFQWTIGNGVCASTSSTMSITRDLNPSTSVAGANQTVCATVATLNGNNPAVGTGTWSLVSGAATITSPNLFNTGLTALGAGINVLQWTIGNGSCPNSSSTVSVQRDLNPSTSVAGTNQTVCATVATLNGNNPAVGTGTWSLVSGVGTITSPNLFNTGLTALGGGINVFQWTIGNGVCANSSSTVIVQRDLNPSTSVAGPSQTICANQATFAANTPVVGVGVWNVITGPGIIMVPTAPNSQVITLGFGSNIFEWQITNGVCPASTSTVEIYQDQNPTVSNAGTSQSVCAATATLNGNIPAIGTGTWTLISGSGVISSPNAPNSALIALGVGVNVFQWTIGSGVCPPSSSTVSVTRNLPPTTANAGPSQSVCANFATLAGNTPAIGTGSWTLISGAGTIASPTLPNSALTALGTGSNVFMWTISNGVCPQSTSTVLIQADAVPTTANAGPNQTVCATTAIMAGNTPAIGTGSWSLVSGVAIITTPTLETTGITALGGGINIFQWTISNGVCPPSTSTVSIQQDLNPSISVAGANQTVCATVATLNGNNPAVGTGTWSLVSGGATITSPNLFNTGLTALAGGVNVLQWTIGNGVCPNSSSTVSVQRDLNPSASVAGASQTVCANFATLNGNNPAVGTGTWSLVSGAATITSPNLFNTGLTALGVGVNVLQWTIGNGVCANSSSTVSVQQDLNPTVANAGPNQTICALTTANMAGNTAAIGTGTWSLISGAGTITSPNLETTGITALGVGVNVFQWTIGNGVCASTSSTMSITRDLNPSTSVAGVNQTVCATFATLNGNNPAVGTGTWSLVSGIATITSPNLFNTGLTALGAGVNVLEWTIGNGSCPNSSSTVSVQRDLNPSTSVAGANQTVCATTATLNGNNPAVGTGTWSLVSGGATITSPNLFNTGLTALAGGINVFQWTIGNGVCANSSSTVIVQRDLNPTVSNAGPSQTICANQGTFAANTPVVGVGVWNVITGPGIIMVPTSPNSQVITLGFGSNIFEWQITNGVCPASTSTVEIYQDQNPTVSNAGTSQSVCATSATLNGNVPAVGTGTWTLISGSGVITSPNAPNSALTSLGVGVNVFQWTIGSGVCPSSSSTVSVTRNLPPTVANAGPSQSVCANFATLAGNTPAIGTGSWTLISGAGTIASPTLPNSGVTALGTSTSIPNVFMWTISNGVCPPSTSTVLIDADAVPTTANAGPNQTLCATVATMAGNTPAIGTGSWTLISGAGTITTPTLETTGITALGAGINIFQWTISNGVCPPSTSTVSIQQDLNPTPSVAGPNQTICATATVLAGNTPLIGTGLWTLVSGGATITTPTLETTGVTAVSIATSNILQWTISNGVCPSSSSTMSIQRDDNPTPSVAGPNQTICATATLLAGNTPLIGTGLWTLVSGGATITTPTLETTGVTAVSIATSNILQWTISNGVCPSSSSTMSIQRDDNPTPSVAGPNQTICATATVLAGNTPVIGTGLWTLVSGGATITTPTLETTGVTAVSIATSNILQWTISNGVCPSSSSTMSIQRDDNPTPSVAGPNQTICATATVLAGNTPVIGTGLWTLVSGGATITTPTLETTGVTAVSIATSNILQWTISNGVCPSSSSTMSIQRDDNPTPSVAGPNQTICATATVLVGNTPVIGTGLWTLVSGGATITTPTLETTGVTAVSIATSNILQWTISNGVCPSSSSTMSIQRDDNPTPSVAGPNQTICATATVLAGNTPVIGTGLWTLVSGGATITTPTLETTGVTAVSIATSNILQWTISNGVCPSSSSTMSIQRDDMPTVSNAGPNQTICATATVLTGNTPVIGTGLWTLVSGGATITTPTLETSGVTAVSIATSNILQWTISNGVCPSSSSTMSIQRDANPTVSNAGPNQTVCSTAATLGGNTAIIGTGLWTLVSGGGTITTPTLETSGLTSLTVGVNVFDWTISNGVCPSSSSTVSIQRDENPTVSNAGPSQSVCSTSATMAGNPAAVGTGTWTLISGSGTISFPNSDNTPITSLGLGTNVFQWAIGNGVCPNSTSTVAITSFTNPTPSVAGPNQTICATATVLAANTPTVGSGVWAVMAGPGVVTSPSSPNSGVTGLTPGLHIFQWSITNGVCPVSSSTVSIQVDPNPSPAVAGPNQTVCVSYANLNATPPAIGTGSWTLVSGVGAIVSPASPTSSITGMPIGVDILQWTTSNGVCPSNSSTVSITSIANVGPVDAGLAVFHCGLTPTLNAVTPVVGTGTWIPISSAPNVASPNNPTTPVTFTSAGTYTYQWLVGYLACPNISSTVQVTLYDMPTPSSVSADQTVCISSANATISANTPAIGTGSWSVAGGSGTVSLPTNTISPVTGLAVGMNSFAWVISNGVCPPSSATVNIQVDDVPSIPVAGVDQTICINSTTSLNATNPAIGNGIWNVLAGGGSVNTPTFNNSGVSSLVVGVNTFEWVLTNGVCPSVTDTTNIFVDALPSSALAGADQFTCSLSTFMAGNIPAIGNGTWVPLGSEPSVNSPTSFSSAVSFTNQGVYSYVWVVGNGVCPTSTDVVTINTFLNPSDPDAGPDQTICAMNTTLNANAITVGTGSWIPVDVLSSVTNSLANTTNATLPNQGVFGFVWQTSNSVYCPNKNDTVYIRTYANPSSANAGLDITSNCLLNPLVAITPSVGNGTWSIISGSGSFNDMNNPNTNYISDVDGFVKLVWTVTNGNCPPTHDTLDIFIDPLLIPQIITPNGDGSNDAFEIKLISCLSGVKISIFNRWGNLVYDSNDYKNDFKGYNNSGEPLADDTYFYILELPKKTYKGYVVVKTD